jgi:hypothetical protein
LLQLKQDGVYTFYSPEPVFDPSIPNLDLGYYLNVRIGEREWYPGTRRHSFGKWSIALKKGFYKFGVSYVDFREGKEDIYFPNNEYKCIWQGEKPELFISGPGLEKIGGTEYQLKGLCGGRYRIQNIVFILYHESCIFSSIRGFIFLT